MLPPMTRADLPATPLPPGFRWAWSDYGAQIHLLHGDAPTWVSVAVVGATYYGSYEVLTGKHRRVYMRRCFSLLPRALGFAQRWLVLRAEDVVAELDGRKKDPTLALDPGEHDWREVRAGRGRMPRGAMRSMNPHSSKGICRIERASKGGLG
ncbi:hypothetical protein [Lysobacter claricitrinus]|uniref:hypothetical protein n=1 Tax=Lysobacter claricitrinus TaxID=3367728 RepID=UPI0037DBA155